MRHLCCPGCRLRFAHGAATYLTACPECGLPPKPVNGSESLIGFRLTGPQDTPHPIDEAVVGAMPVPAYQGPRNDSSAADTLSFLDGTR